MHLTRLELNPIATASPTEEARKKTGGAKFILNNNFLDRKEFPRNMFSVPASFKGGNQKKNKSAAMF